MLYAGHFVFETYDGEKRIGYFNLMVDAADVATAKICFRNRLALLRQQTDLFSGSTRIFLDGIVEFLDIPQEVILTNYRTFHGDPPPSIYNILPEQQATGCRIYSVIPDTGEHSFPKIEPFLTFE